VKFVRDTSALLALFAPILERHRAKKAPCVAKVTKEGGPYDGKIPIDQSTDNLISVAAAA
jgi:hypothetical protein